MRRVRFMALGGLAAVALALSMFAAAVANPGSVIDFEGLAEGSIVSSVATGGNGISGPAVAGSVSVFGLNPSFGGGTNAAMIFDSSCPPGGSPSDCGGGDDDLGTPNEAFGGPGVSNDGSGASNNTALGNVLIITEDLDSSDPDDADLVGARFDFDFSGWGSGKVTVNSLRVLDVEAVEPSAEIELFSGGPGGTLLAPSPISVASTGDNGAVTVAIGVSGVDFVRVTLNGSGAIDSIDITPEEPPGDEGCTPGFWKNHLDEWAPSGLSPADDFDTTFGVDLFDPDITLGDAIKLKGGGVKKLGRHGTAALISALHPDVGYPFTGLEVIALVQAGNAHALATANELGCPLD